MKIFLAGHTGMVGRAILRKLEQPHQTDKGLTIITKSSAELDLRDQAHVKSFIFDEKPDAIILAAAKVGGIHANSTYPADFIYDNLMIQCNVINAAYQTGVRRLLQLGSSCIYPKFATQPITEAELLAGKLETTNEPYAVAKIAGIKLCESYNRQYGTDYRSIMPTNLYGPGDNFHPENSHVIPALIQRFHKAVEHSLDEVVIWGSGNPRREFLHVDDMADAALHVLNLDGATYTREVSQDLSHINIGWGMDITIRELAKTIASVIGFEGTIKFDASKPDGTPRKLLDVSLINRLGWRASIELEEGIRETYEWFRAQTNKTLRKQ